MMQYMASKKGEVRGRQLSNSKLLMQHTRNCGVENLYIIFLDLKKAYYSLDQDWTMTILKGYGMGRNLLAFIKRVLDGDTMVSKQGGFFGILFDVGQGVR
jgi:hypothetical protein